MAHFARIEDNIVQQVVVINNLELQDVNGNEVEAQGIAFCQTLFGAESEWKQTSYHGNIRKNFAGIGYTFDAARDAFIAPKPFNSWILDEETCQWTSPVPYPDEEGSWGWDEESLSWIELLTGD